MLSRTTSTSRKVDTANRPAMPPNRIPMISDSKVATDNSKVAMASSSLPMDNQAVMLKLKEDMTRRKVLLLPGRRQRPRKAITTANIRETMHTVSPCIVSG